MHNLLITVSVLVSVMPFWICHAQLAQMKKFIYIVLWVIAAAKKVIYIEQGDSSRKIGAICSFGNHFKCELLRKHGGSPHSIGGFPASNYN